jgi:AAA+ ATPase superfamily predicted ATPase
MDFINREAELEVLERAVGAAPPALFVLYGRRRVGKTALLRRAAEGWRHVFFTADLGSRADQLSSFTACLSQGLGEEELAGVTFPGWEEALRFVAARARRRPLVLVLDEFQHLVAADPSLASVLQRLWDTEIQETFLSLVLCGSYVGFMEREVLGARKPLYGRRTGQLLLQPLLYRDAARFFPSWGSERRMTAASILGGIPAYLRQFDPEADLETNVLRSILGLGAPLFDEPRFLMMEQLREPQIYFSICRAIAHGGGQPNEIAQAAGLVGRGNLAAYLTTLREMRFVERRVPVSVRNPERTRRGLYRLGDPFLRFWFRFVLPQRSSLEAGDAELVWRRKIVPHLAQHVSLAFEQACREHLRELNRRGELPAEYDRVGSWWRGGEEVDAAAVGDDGPLLLAECKWTSRPLGRDVLLTLEAKAPAVAADLQRTPSRVDLALFSRAGFTPDLEAEAAARGVALFTVEDVLGPAGSS